MILYRAHGADFQVGGLMWTRKREQTRGSGGHATLVTTLLSSQSKVKKKCLSCEHKTNGWSSRAL